MVYSDFVMPSDAGKQRGLADECVEGEGGERTEIIQILERFAYSSQTHTENMRGGVH